jgi:hypothetical protein
MERGVVVRGRLHGRWIALDDSVDELDGDVEVVVRAVAGSHPTVEDMLKLVATFPPGARTKEDVDRHLAEDRAGWGR